MKNKTTNLTSRQAYLVPEVEQIEVLIEQGFANSIEEVGKDEETHF